MEKTILLVEDNIKIINFICATLENSEYKYFVAKTGKEAIEIIQKETQNGPLMPECAIIR